MSMTRKEIRAMMVADETTPEQSAKDDGAFWAEEAVEASLNDALVDDARHDAQRDLWNRTGAQPELDDGQLAYVETFITGFADEFRKLYPAAYSAAYREAYRQANADAVHGDDRPAAA